MAGRDPAISTRTDATCKRCSPGQQPSHAGGRNLHPVMTDSQRQQYVNHQGRWYHSQGAAITALHAAGNAGG